MGTRALGALVIAALIGISACTPTAAPAASGNTVRPATAPGAAANPASGQKISATLRLDWVPGAHHIGPLLAFKRGYYAQEGIDLSVQPGKGSGVTVQSVASGQDMFGFADAGIMAVAASKGAPLIMVLNVTPLGPSGIISLGAKVTDPKQLEGKSLAVAAGDASFAAFPAVAKKYNIPESAYKTVTIEAASKVPALLEKKVDYMPGFQFGDYLRVLEQAKDAKITLYSEWGVNTLGNGYFVTQGSLKDKPDLVKGFVRATLKGWEDARKDPAAGVQALVEAFPDASKQQGEVGLPMVIDHMQSDATKGKPLGWMAESDWKQTLDVMKGNGLEGDRAPSTFYTNDFIPPS